MTLKALKSHAEVNRSMQNAESLAYCFVRQQEVAATIEPETSSALRQYEPDFDTTNYTNFNKLTFLNPKIRQQELEKLDTYTRTNLRTMLAEHFHVLLSTRTDIIQDGALYAPYSQEPLLHMYLRGKEYRQKNGSIASDQEREQAEVDNFVAIQQSITDPNTPDNTMYLVVSQPGKEGTEYCHNFYDIYIKKGNTVEYRRYSSALGKKETFEKMLQLDPTYAQKEREDDPSFVPDDVYFLQTPIRIDPAAAIVSSAEALHAFFHIDHSYMNKDEFDYLLAATKGYRDAYIQIVADNKHDIKMRNLAYNAYLNKADMVAKELQQRKENRELIVYDRAQFSVPTHAELMHLGSQPVREVTTGCGKSGGMSIADIINQNPIRDITRSAFGVVDFAQLQLTGDLGYSFDQEGNCVSCGKEGAKVGPCGICEACDRAIRREQGLKMPFTAQAA